MSLTPGSSGCDAPATDPAAAYPAGRVRALLAARPGTTQSLAPCTARRTVGGWTYLLAVGDKRVDASSAGETMELDTVGKRLYWSYANLAMAHAAVECGAVRYRLARG